MTDTNRRAFRALGSRKLSRWTRPSCGLLGMMYSVDRHGKHHGLTHLELELNQALFDDPRSVARLARVTARALETV